MRHRNECKTSFLHVSSDFFLRVLNLVSVIHDIDPTNRRFSAINHTHDGVPPSPAHQRQTASLATARVSEICKTAVKNSAVARADFMKPPFANIEIVAREMRESSVVHLY